MKVLIKPKVNKNKKETNDIIYAYEPYCPVNQYCICINQGTFPCGCVIYYNGD